MVHHREPPKVIHLDNVVEPAEPSEPETSFHIHTKPESYLALPAGGPVVVDEFWKQTPDDRSAENEVDDGNNSASADFYNMVLNILDTFHSAAEVEVRRSRKRDFQRQAELDMLF